MTHTTALTLARDALAEKLREAFHAKTQIGHPMWRNLSDDRKAPWLAAADAASELAASADAGSHSVSEIHQPAMPEDFGVPTLYADRARNYALWLLYEEGAQGDEVDARWQPIETAPKEPRTRILLKWHNGRDDWLCIGAWASSDDSPRLKTAGCPREGWTPDGGTCIPRNQRDCAEWMPLPAALAQQGSQP